MRFPENSTVVVAHGAWVDGSSWKEVILFLSKPGLQAIAALLPYFCGFNVFDKFALYIRGKPQREHTEHTMAIARFPRIKASAVCLAILMFSFSGHKSLAAAPQPSAGGLVAHSGDAIFQQAIQARGLVQLGRCGDRVSASRGILYRRA
jgi:hypothetical protein